MDADRESIPPDFRTWERDSPAFRAIFLQHAPTTEAAETLRRFGRLLFHWILEYGPGAGPPESSTRSELRAGALDLRTAQSYLLHVAQGRIASDLPPEDERLAILAGNLAAEVGTVAERIEATLGPIPERPT